MRGAYPPYRAGPGPIRVARRDGNSSWLTPATMLSVLDHTASHSSFPGGQGASQMGGIAPGPLPLQPLSTLNPGGSTSQPTGWAGGVDGDWGAHALGRGRHQHPLG